MSSCHAVATILVQYRRVVIIDLMNRERSSIENIPASPDDVPLNLGAIDGVVEYNVLILAPN